jgi:thiamine biosynthesis lipoprotein
MLDESFAAMGTVVRVVRERDTGLDVRAAFAEIERRLSRFNPASDLSRLNADPRPAVPAAPLLRAAVAAALRAACLSGGLVDPTLLAPVRGAGYRRSRAHVQPESVRQALLAAPARQPARPDPNARWRAVTVDDGAGVIRRPPGLGLDLGGSAKGWAADRLAEQLEPCGRYAVNCGGDLRVVARHGPPWEVRVRHPLSGRIAQTLHVRAGGVATSGIDARLWRRSGDEFAHHLIDPASGRPAWTGLIAATALGPSALEAEALAKAALLSGPAAGRALLRTHHGGVLVCDDGTVIAVDAALDGVDQKAPQRRRLHDRLHRSHAHRSVDAVNLVEPGGKLASLVRQHTIPLLRSARP